MSETPRCGICKNININAPQSLIGYCHVIDEITPVAAEAIAAKCPAYEEDPDALW